MNKIIIIADWLIDYITKEICTFARHLQTYHDWTIIMLSKLNVGQLKQKKSIVLCITYDNLDISVLKCENITLIYKIDDLLPSSKVRQKCVEYADLLISPYQYLFKKESLNLTYPLIKFKESYHIPYSAIDSFYKNIEFNNAPKEKVLVSGAVGPVYPLRQSILNYKKYIDVLNHPGYENNENNENKIIDEKYYRKLSEYLCCFTDASAFCYILLKVFEICSVGSLLLCDNSIEKELYKLGFRNNINYISCNKDTLQSKIEWILNKKNRTKVDEIRLNGMELVRRNHNTINRSETFNSIIDNKYCKSPDVSIN